MSLLNEYFDRMKAQDYLGIAALFDRDATLDDSCLSGMFQTETHLIGSEAINIHYANRFLYQTYLFAAGKELSDNQGEMDVVIVGKPTKVKVCVAQETPQGKIKALTICPAES